MKCPFCGEVDTKVVDSRPMDGGAKIKRRRQCLACNKRFNTFEMIDTVPLMVTKKGGSIELFNREKLIRGIIRATEKRPVTMAMVEELVARIETNLRNGMGAEITTGEIGDLVMQELLDIDQVAYIRFASVYKKFNDLESFQEELKKIQRRKREKERKSKPKRYTRKR